MYSKFQVYKHVQTNILFTFAVYWNGVICWALCDCGSAFSSVTCCSVTCCSGPCSSVFFWQPPSSMHVCNGWLPACCCCTCGLRLMMSASIILNKSIHFYFPVDCLERSPPPPSEEVVCLYGKTEASFKGGGTWFVCLHMYVYVLLLKGTLPSLWGGCISVWTERSLFSRRGDLVCIHECICICKCVYAALGCPGSARQVCYSANMSMHM